MKLSAKTVMGIIVMMLSPFFVQAQMLDPVTFTVIESPESAKAGEVFEVKVKATIDGNWHLYSVANDPDAGPYPTQFSSANPGLAIAGKITESDPVIEWDPNFDAELGWHSKEAAFTIPLAFKKSAKGSAMIDLEVLYQVCNDKACLPPKTKSITQALTVSGVAENFYPGFEKSEKSGEESVQTGEKQSIVEAPVQGEIETSSSGYGSSGIFSFLWIALTAGFAALLTPCVFPMIPLTVSYFTKQGERDNEAGIGQAFIFGIAIILTFTLLGGLLAFFIGAAGAIQFATNPWVNLFIALVLIVFAVSLLGAFELRLPHQLTNWLNQKSNESSGMIGILFMALTISAVSFSCTAPFVGGVLAATAGGEWFYPVIGMAGFATAFASPFVLLAIFPDWLESLPKSGSWMNIVKVLLGFIELAAAFKFLSNADLVWQWNLISRPFTIAAWIAIFLLAGLYLLGVFSINHERKPQKIGTGRLLLSIPFLLFSFYLIPGLMGASLGIWDAWLPPKQATDVSVVRTLAQQRSFKTTAVDAEVWSSSFEESMEAAKEKNKPVFIDFTGYTCTNCRAMEANVFPLDRIQKRFAKMEQVRLYTDGGIDGPENQRFQLKLTGTVALPTYAIVNPWNGKVLEQLVGYTNANEFRQFLDVGIQEFHKISNRFQTGLN
ncbi:MAG TPA: cytochrome c biogenesis protein CcdA [Balneolaceae bacterium]|nr:cytochrome c biogenesis protein CcdA [Balneolaceae bacterium]